VFQRIVVGYAGDQAGSDAVRLAAILATLCDSELTVVFPYGPLLAATSAERAEEMVREQVSALISPVASSLEPTFHWTPSSWPIRGLHEMAGYEGADLLVIGSTLEGRHEHRRVSLMERMVHGAPCAVATAPAQYSQGEHRELRRVGVGFSTSSEGMAALELARQLAARAGGRLLIIAAAGLEPALASYGFASQALPELERRLLDQTRRNLVRATENFGGEVPVQRETIGGEPADVLIERSQELDIMVLGSRAYGPLRHALLGSVSAEVMREARCPVLVQPRGVDGTPAAPPSGSSGPS
jgi:nucleotide-binding universal stress UspA family protein